MGFAPPSLIVTLVYENPESVIFKLMSNVFVPQFGVEMALPIVGLHGQIGVNDSDVSKSSDELHDELLKPPNPEGITPPLLMIVELPSFKS